MSPILGTILLNLIKKVYLLNFRLFVAAFIRAFMLIKIVLLP